MNTKHDARGGRVCLALGLGLLALVSSRALAAPPPTEHQVKAAFLLHFAKLVAWPDWPPAGGDDHAFEIAVVGRDPFGEQLEATIGASLVQGRPIRIRRAPKIEELGRLPQILVVGDSDLEHARRVLEAVKDSPVLTVGEARDFAKAGGIVGFRVTPEGRVAFDVNVERAERTGLRVSSQLLRVARVVETRP